MEHFSSGLEAGIPGLTLLLAVGSPSKLFKLSGTCGYIGKMKMKRIASLIGFGRKFEKIMHVKGLIQWLDVNGSHLFY